MSEEILGESTAALIKRASSDAITSWTDEKKKDFVKTFDDRTRVARYILISTANQILDVAQRRQFISSKHREGLKTLDTYYLHDHEAVNGYHHRQGTVGGRVTSDLDDLAQQRAKLILKELPPLKQAVMVLDVGVAEKIDRKEQIMAELKKLKEKLEDPDLSGAIKMSEVDQKMSVADFRKMVKDRAKARKRLFEKMDELGAEGYELEEFINKKLYKGLPGLSDAVVSVVQQHLDRATAMDEMDRRVGERVMFGDSDAALEMLKGFEKDEQEVPDHIKKEFKAAMEKLKLSKKQLTAGKVKAKK